MYTVGDEDAIINKIKKLRRSDAQPSIYKMERKAGTG